MMIEQFVQVWDAHKEEVRSAFCAAHPGSYVDVVRAVIKMLHDHIPDYYRPDPSRIHEIDDGDYQGTLVYVIGTHGYQPSTYWAVMVGYGSCSGCDTLQSISNYSSDPPTIEQINDYMTLALHIVQRLSRIGGEIA